MKVVCALMLGVCVTLNAGCVELPRACGDVGCGSIAQLNAFEIVDDAPLIGASVRVCRNAACSSGHVMLVPQMFQTGQGGELVGELRASFVVWRTTNGYELIVDVTGNGEAASAFAAGDVYTVEVRDSDSLHLSTRSWSAMYDQFPPNGPGCDGVCYQAELTPL